MNRTVTCSLAALEVITFETPGLGDRSYLVHDGRFAVVVDPQRDHLTLVHFAEDLGVRIEAVLETHIHNDYVTGGLALARTVGARYFVPDGEEVEFVQEATALCEGDEVGTSSFALRTLSTPGHTPYHLSYVVESTESAIFSGGSLLYGGVGRTDLTGPDAAVHLADKQWRSVNRILRELPGDARIFPTHGFGSFCSAISLPSGSSIISTIEIERHDNLAAKFELDDFVMEVTADPPPIPRYYQYMAPLNRKGPPAADLGRTIEIAPTVVVSLRDRGVWCIDIRNRREFARGHFAGAVNIELSESLPTYFGWVVPFDSPYVLVAQSADDVDEAERLLARIGRERSEGYVHSRVGHTSTAEIEEHYRVATFSELAEATESNPAIFVLDVRHCSEFLKGHVKGANHIAVYDLRPDDYRLSRAHELWIYCAAGYRAAIASSLLEIWGYTPIFVDDSFSNATAAGLHVTIGKEDSSAALANRAESSVA